MTMLLNELTKIEQAQAYVNQKRYENNVIDRNLDGSASDELLEEVMAESDFMFDWLISHGHTRADLIRVAGL